MTDPTPLHQPKQSDNPVALALQDVLANTYGLYFTTHNYHWNVEGANFVQLHQMFDGQYKELFKAVDVIAERIRALGDYALPFEGDSMIQLSKMTSNPLNKETDAHARATRMIHNLITLNDAVITSCQTAKHAAQTAHDDESESALVERITAHQKAVWLLLSIVK